MLKLLVALGTGIYAGMYVTQNYNVPRVDDPAKILGDARQYIEDHRKK